MCSNFNADNDNMNNGISSNSMGRGSNRPRGTSGRGRGVRHDFYNNSKFLLLFYLTFSVLVLLYIHLQKKKIGSSLLKLEFIK